MGSTEQYETRVALSTSETEGTIFLGNFHLNFAVELAQSNQDLDGREKSSTKHRGKVVCAKMMTSIKKSVRMLVSCVRPAEKIEHDEEVEFEAQKDKADEAKSDLIELTESYSEESDSFLMDEPPGLPAHIVKLDNTNPITSVSKTEQSCPFEFYRQKISRFVLIHRSSVQSRSLLPERSFQDLEKKCLILDLDETLIHSQFQRVPLPDLEVPIQFEDNQVKPIYVCKRPGVDEFLEFAGKHFEVVIFTASLASYADPVIDFLDRTGTIRHRLYRDSCLFAEGLYLKDLSMLGRPLDQVIIIDNAATSYLLQPENGVSIKSWFSDLEDAELLGRLMPALVELPHCPDVHVWKKAWSHCISHQYNHL